jgi:outer membrane protein
MKFPKTVFAALTFPLALTAEETPPAATTATSDIPAATVETVAAPITLDDAIRRALEKNFIIRASAIGKSIADARVTEQFGRFDPVLSYGAFTSENDPPPPLGTDDLIQSTSYLTKSNTYDVALRGLMPWGMTYKVLGSAQNRRAASSGFSDRFSSYGGIEITQPLLKGFGIGTNLAQITIARNNRAISEWDYRNSITNTVTQVIYAYNELYYSEQYLKISERSRDLAANLLAEIEKRVRVGQMSESEISTARSRVLTREDVVLSARQRVSESRNSLRQLVTDTKKDVLDTPMQITVPPKLLRPPANPAADFATALTLRPDWQQAQLQHKNRRTSAALQRNSALPSVNLVYSHGYNGLDGEFSQSRRQVFDGEHRSHSTGVVVSIPLTMSEDRGRARAARLTVRQSELQLDGLEQDIMISIGNAATRIESARQRMETSHEGRVLAQKSLDDTLKLLRAGKSSAYYVLQEQQELAFAEQSELRALVDYNRAVADYDRQIGTTLERHHIAFAD